MRAIPTALTACPWPWWTPATATARVPVFAGLSFATGLGEAVAVTGPNGSGKSTLLR
ncbi:ATP-binding cassette domain-containing protein [Lentzea sp. NPDC059081]|uniref:ATP-binding cassette domain-containing protein n=1 Tax=Lentzea sp. NPDC059081 TaxID=3346719 RepID=UPI003699CC0C